MSLKSRAFLQSCIQHTARWTFTLSVLAAVAYAAFIAVRFHHLDTRIYAWVNTWKKPAAPATGAQGRALQNYTLQSGTLQIAGVRRNLSGLAFDADHQQLVAVVNRPATLLRLSLGGQLLSSHPLEHAADVEGVAYLGQGRIALLEEGRSRVLFAQLPDAKDSPVDLQKAFALQLSLNAPEKAGVGTGNQGFEGLGYDAKRDYLYVAKEHSPRALYRISGIAKPQDAGAANSISIENLNHWVESDSIVGTDLSSVEVDPTTGHVLLLSDESQSLVELDQSGGFVGRVALSSWRDKNASIPQAEGIAIDPYGVIYIVSEPNLFYRLQPRQAHARR
ncbi:MAG: DNA-binding protein [Comamonadaceae bacterium]|nr:MAG: DNA-binding protein [Comamonadaceae bacterium]